MGALLVFGSRKGEHQTQQITWSCRYCTYEHGLCQRKERMMRIKNQVKVELPPQQRGPAVETPPQTRTALPEAVTPTQKLPTTESLMTSHHALQAGLSGPGRVGMTRQVSSSQRAGATPPLSSEAPQPTTPPSNGAPQATPAPEGITSYTQPWRPIDAPVQNQPGQRDANSYSQVIDQFNVESNGRYEKGHQGHGETYCNIFAWDVTKAMGAEIPHWVDRSGNPTGVGQGRELSANGTHAWLGEHGAAHGWREASAEEAQAAANNGQPSVATWPNPGGIGHMGVIRPGEINDRGPALAQAGRRNIENGHVSDGFGNASPTYWVHD